MRCDNCTLPNCEGLITDAGGNWHCKLDNYQIMGKVGTITDCESKDVLTLYSEHTPRIFMIDVNPLGEEFCRRTVPEEMFLEEEIRLLFEKALAYKRRQFDKDWPKSELGYTAVKREAFHLCHVLIPDCSEQKLGYEIDKHIRELREAKK